MTWLVVAYAVIGLVLGVYAAAREYRDESVPADNTSAGVVGFFVACFWPVVVVIVALGIAGRWALKLGSR
jgi:hypothetical protein